ncbi:MAG: 30S ribosomal protein S16 [bacterium]
MVKIRLKRLGRKRNPIYKIVVISSQSKREGDALEFLGNYEPKTKLLTLKKAEALEWLKKGAQPTDTVKYLIENSDDNGNLVRKEKQETVA